MIFGWGFAGHSLALELQERGQALSPFREAGSDAQGWTKPLEPWN